MPFCITRLQDKDSDKAKHAEECSRKRDQLVTYKNADHIVQKDPLGNEKEYNDSERKKLIELTQKQIEVGCTDVTN